MNERGRPHRLTCKHGHPMAGANLIIQKSGKRRCRSCREAEAQRRTDRAVAFNPPPVKKFEPAIVREWPLTLCAELPMSVLNVYHPVNP